MICIPVICNNSYEICFSQYLLKHSFFSDAFLLYKSSLKNRTDNVHDMDKYHAITLPSTIFIK